MIFTQLKKNNNNVVISNFSLSQKLRFNPLDPD